jgi:hypothetical protein
MNLLKYIAYFPYNFYDLKPLLKNNSKKTPPRWLRNSTPMYQPTKTESKQKPKQNQITKFNKKQKPNKHHEKVNEFRSSRYRSYEQFLCSI